MHEVGPGPGPHHDTTDVAGIPIVDFKLDKIMIELEISSIYNEKWSRYAE